MTSIYRQGAKLFAATLLAATALAVATLPGRAEYPKGTINVIVPFAAGGSSDALARLYANKLGALLGQTVVIDNRPGASGNIGIAATAKSKPDGLTIMFSSSAVTWNPALFRKLEFDPIKDIIPVARLADSPQVINVNAAKFPNQSLKEVIQFTKDNPGKVNLGASGVGLIEAQFAAQNNLDVEIIRYNSSSEAMTALMSGEADIFMGSALNVVPVMATGKIRPIAVTGDNRMGVLPNVPTTKEAGFPQVQASYLFGAFVAGGTPPAVVAELNGLLNKITADPAVVAELTKLGWAPKSQTAESFQKEYSDEITEWKAIAKRAKIEPLD